MIRKDPWSYSKTNEVIIKGESGIVVNPDAIAYTFKSPYCVTKDGYRPGYRIVAKKDGELIVLFSHTETEEEAKKIIDDYWKEYMK